MLKHYDIIGRLSDNDKIHILCDIKCLSDKNYRVLGIPDISTSTLEELLDSDLPSPEALANSWDLPLIGRVADEAFKKAILGEKGFVKIPGPKIRINPYRKAISEDPFLASEISKQYVCAGQKADIAVGMSGFGLHSDETEWLDDLPNERFIQEFIVKPYKSAAEGARCAAIFSQSDLAQETYHNVNSSLMDEVSAGNIASGCAAVCNHVSAEKTVSLFTRGGLTFDGEASVLESALSRYKKISRDIEHGNATTEELAIEVGRGRAISPEQLDEALDRLLDFVFKVRRRPTLSTSMADKTLSLEAAAKSVVLLKNQKSILPLKKVAKVGFIGDIGIKEDGEGFVNKLAVTFAQSGYTSTGVERGYNSNSDRSEELISDAVSLANHSDIVFVFLGELGANATKTHKTKKLLIPANQQALLDNLKAESQKVVAILPSDYPTDIGIPENCAAILLAPLGVNGIESVLFGTLTGMLNPSGKLANTVYFDTERRYVEYKTHRVRDGIKVGPFVGYRYYDSDSAVEGFPFGHGLSYTHFAYSALTVANGTVTFTVKNDGKAAGTETAQIYVGKSTSNVLRAKKELTGFVRIELQPGERKTLSIPLKLPEVYCEDKKAFVEEAGEYTVYVGSSVADIRLTQHITAGGVHIASDNQKKCDYIHSESNIHSDSFKLEAKSKTMKKSVFNIVAGACSLVLAVILKLYCASNGLDSAFFDIFAIILGIAGIVFFVAEAIRRNQMQIRERAELDKLNNKEFANAEQINVYSADEMFVNEFDVAETATTAETDDHAEGIDAEYLQYIDKNQNFEAAAQDFQTFALERGCKFRTDEVKKVFAALAASRLVVVTGMDNNTFKSFMMMLTNYFETSLYIDQADETYVNSDSVLFKTDAQGNRMKTNVNFAIEAARTTRHNIHFAALTNVCGINLPMYFTSFVNYAKNPTASHHITVLNEKNIETSYYLPQNMWFVLNLAENESILSIPDFVLDVATVNSFAFDTCQNAEQYTLVKKFSYYQMDWLTEKTASKVSIDEDTWKKIDRIEEFANAHTPFHIGNKLWLCLEKFAYVYVACGGEKISAIDEALAAKLMIPVMSALQDKLTSEDRSVEDTVETILGDGRADACKKAIKACGSNNV